MSILCNKETEKFTLAFKPDIVQLNILHGYYINGSEYLQFLKEQGIAVCYTMMDEYAYLGKCPYSFSCNQFKTACVGKCPERSLIRRVYSLISQRKYLKIRRKLIKV